MNNANLFISEHLFERGSASMVLAIDIGNTNIVMGAISEENGRRRIHFTSRISTDKSKTADQHAVEVKDILNMYGLDVSALDGAIIASVVPSLSFVFASAIERVIGIKPMMVEPGMKTGLDIKIDNPAQQRPEEKGEQRDDYSCPQAFEQKQPMVVRHKNVVKGLHIHCRYPFISFKHSNVRSSLGYAPSR